MPTAKRIICGSAQGRSDPPATEKSIRNPMQPTADSSSTSDQLTARSLAEPLRRAASGRIGEAHARSRAGTAGEAASGWKARCCSSIWSRCSAG